MPSHSDDQPVLIYDRIDENRRWTRFLLVVFAAMSTPVVLYAVQYVMAVVAMSSTMTATSGLGAGAAPEIPLIPLMIASAVISILLTIAAAYLVYRFSAAIVLRLTGARVLKSGEEPDLERVVENLCIGAGLPKPRLAIVESTATNAYSTGLEPESATLVVTRGLLVLMDQVELEGVVAQELSQIGNGDVQLGTVLGTVVTLMVLPYILAFAVLRVLFRLHRALALGCLVFLAWFVAMIVFAIGFGVTVMLEDATDPATRLFLVFGMLIPVYAIFVGPGIGYLLRLAISREREFLADADAALLTRYPPGLARALTKIAAPGNAAVRTRSSLRHLWIVDPGKRWGFLSTHPSIGERIDVLFRMGGTTPEMLLEAEEVGLKYREAVVGLAKS